MIWWHMIGGGVVWCAWYAYLFIFWCAWYAKILMYLLFWSNMIGGGMVWSAWYAGRVEGLPAEALQPLPRSLNLHNIFILSKYHFSYTYHFNLITLRFTQLVSICIGIHPPSPSSMNKRADASEFLSKTGLDRLFLMYVSEKNYLN